MMEVTNSLYKLKDSLGMQKSSNWRMVLESLLQLLAPFSPHIAEELWHQLGNSDTIHVDHWPIWEEKYLLSDVMKIVVQVNGKVRATIEVDSDATEAQVLDEAKTNEKVATYLSDNEIKNQFTFQKTS